MIVVTGATGQLGRTVVERLLDRMPARRIVASVRDPAKAAGLAEKGIKVRAGDFAKPDDLATAFAGGEQVLVISPDQLGETGRRLSRAAIDAARAAGAHRVLYTSHMGTHRNSPFADHAEIEKFLAEAADMPFTSLRHGFYAQSAFYLIGRGIADGAIIAPEDGPVSWTARADLAEADAIVLAQEGRLAGITPPLTAGEAYTMDDVAAIASTITGREIRRITVTDDEWRNATVARGVPAHVADMLLDTYRAARHGDFATVDPTLGVLLGRPPQTMRDILASTLTPDNVRASATSIRSVHIG